MLRATGVAVVSQIDHCADVTQWLLLLSVSHKKGEIKFLGRVSYVFGCHRLALHIVHGAADFLCVVPFYFPVFYVLKGGDKELAVALVLAGDLRLIL